MDGRQKSAFDLPEDVARKLLQETDAEALATGSSDKPLFALKLDILKRKTREYWEKAAD
ncbi:MAG TPA: hypothetical protein VL002_03605 [Candidimonas sp.]|nr:hypothetical protein [Candidimonas sp.]